MANDKDDRNEKGQFKSGHKGGPGRSKKKDKYEWVDDLTEYDKKMASMARREHAAMFNDPDKKVRQEALKLHARYFGMDTDKKKDILDPKLLDAFGKWFL